MQTIIENGMVTEVHINQREFNAFEIISQYKDLGLPPRDLMKALNRHKLTPSEIRNGTKAYNFSRKGAEVLLGSGHIHREPGWYDDKADEPFFRPGFYR